MMPRYDKAVAPQGRYPCPSSGELLVLAWRGCWHCWGLAWQCWRWRGAGAGGDAIGVSLWQAVVGCPCGKRLRRLHGAACMVLLAWLRLLVMGDFKGQCIEVEALLAGDCGLAGVILPWTHLQQVPCRAGIETLARGLVKWRESVLAQ